MRQFGRVIAMITAAVALFACSQESEVPATAEPAQPPIAPAPGAPDIPNIVVEMPDELAEAETELPIEQPDS